MNFWLKLATRMATMILLIIIVWGCGAIPTIKEGSEGVYVRLPFVRVLLDTVKDNVKLSGTTSFSLECFRGEESYVYHGSKAITVKQNNGTMSVYLADGKIGDKYTEILISPRGNRGYLTYNKTKYRGMIRVLSRGRKIQVINVIHMDDYLLGVVPPEIGFFKGEVVEAIKAQAVAARTYAMSHINQYPDEEYDMKADVSDQVYLGVDSEIDVVSKAVNDTRGFVMKYRGKLINAYYHSTCGGYTDDIEDVWEKRDMPYLRAVADENCKWSKYYNWKESFTRDQLKLMIEQYLSSERGRRIKIGKITDIFVKSTTSGGRVAQLEVMTENHSYKFGRDKIRWVFKRASNPEMILQSARFDIKLKRKSNGEIERIDLIGGGYGHGVGMCQCGAIGMSRKGEIFQNILKHFYTNIDLVKMY